MLFTHRPLKIACLTLGLLAFPASAIEDNSFTNALKSLLTQAEESIQQGEHQLAESHYRVALLETWMQRAMLEVVRGDWPAARDALAESTRSAATGERRTRSSLALVQLWIGEVDEAMEQLRYLAERHPKNTQVQQLLAQALLANGRFDEAAEQLETMRPRVPKVVEQIEHYVADFDLKEKEKGTKSSWEERREAFLPALGGGAFAGLPPEELTAEEKRLRATQVRVYRNLGSLHRGHAACSEALDDRAQEIEAQDATPRAWAQKAYGTLDLEQNPLVGILPLRADVTALWQNAKAEHLPAMRRVEAGELSAAEDELRKMLEEGDDPVARDILGVLLAERGELEQAREHFAAIVAATPEFLSARQHLLRLDQLNGRLEPDPLQQELRAIAELGPLDRDLGLELAAIELAAGETGAAQQRLFDIAHRFSSPRAFLQLVQLLAHQGDVQEAVKNAIKAMRLAPSSEEVLATYAQYAYRADQADDTLGTVEPLTRLYPHNARYRFLYGAALSARDEPSAARAALETALEMDPALADAHRELSIVCAQLTDSECSEQHLKLYRETLQSTVLGDLPSDS